MDGSTAIPGVDHRSAPPSTSFVELTRREMEILEQVAKGPGNKLIAKALNITDGTAKPHVKAILRKLGVDSRVKAAALAVEHGLGKRKGPP